MNFSEGMNINNSISSEDEQVGGNVDFLKMLNKIGRGVDNLEGGGCAYGVPPHVCAEVEKHEAIMAHEQLRRAENKARKETQEAYDSKEDLDRAIRTGIAPRYLELLKIEVKLLLESLV